MVSEGCLFLLDRDHIPIGSILKSAPTTEFNRPRRLLYAWRARVDRARAPCDKGDGCKLGGIWCHPNYIRTIMWLGNNGKHLVAPRFPI